MRIKVLSPATSANLGPGFDTLGLAMQIYNELEIHTDAAEFTIEVEGAGRASLPRDKRSLVYKAIAKVYAAVGKPVPPLRVRQINRIPVASGLGSSAAAIVGGLTAANHLLGSPLTQDDLLQLAVEIEGHPDNVAPALLGAVVASGVDSGKVIWYQIKPANPPHIVVISLISPVHSQSPAGASQDGAAGRRCPQYQPHRIFTALFRVGRLPPPALRDGRQTAPDLPGEADSRVE